MRWIEVKRSGPLKGNIRIPGSKNSSLGILTACCLSDGPVVLKNIPDISDVKLVCDIGRDIGMDIKKSEGTYFIDPTRIHSSVIDLEKAASYRASYYYIGALLHKFKRVSIGYPGGDNFGSRPIDQHIKGLKALGAKFRFYNEYYTVEADRLKGTDIYFDVVTCGATINLLLAAVLAEGRTILRNAARDPEVVDMAVFLNNMGAKIKGAGTDTIIIDGVEGLSGCTYSVIPDRLIAGSFLIGAGATGGSITVNGVIPEHLVSCTSKLEEAGLNLESGDDYVKATSGQGIKGITIKTGMYPGFATDYQQPITAMLLGSQEHSTIIDTVYPGRFSHCQQLNRMGADIILREGSIVVTGGRRLKGTWVHAADVRAGICLILAGLMAEGTTFVTGIEHIERGYTDIVDNFISLGAEIRMCEDKALIPQEEALLTIK